MAIFKNLVNALTGIDDQKKPVPPDDKEPVAEKPTPEIPKPKPPRIVIDATVIRTSDEGAGSDGILIKAKPSADNSECRFAINRVVFADKAWYFSSRGATRGSQFVEAVFAADEDIESVLVHNTWLTITRRNKAATDWKPLAETVGAVLREQLSVGSVEMPAEITDAILPDDDLQAAIQTVIDEEINPGVSSHGGVISIVSVKGNVATINMGGGCQGCSSAAMTLKGGIERSFRERIPTLGAILDATDHTAGSNPYFN